MKIAVLTSKERCELYTDRNMIPEGCELVYIGQKYTAEQVLERAGDAQVILVDAVLPVDAAMIENMPELKMIHSEGVAFNAIDLDCARSRGVFVCNNRAVNAAQVAEHAVMLMLTVMRRFSEGEMLVRAGRQAEAKSRFIMEGLPDLTGCRVGIVGFGASGRELAKRLAPFGCALSYYKPRREPKELEEEYSVTYMQRDELFKSCDIISLHVPVVPETVGMICRETLAMMKSNAIIVNCARGALVRNADLAEAIRNGVIYGAGLDTMDPEPVPADDPLLTLPQPYCSRVSVTPHIAGTTKGVFFASYRGFWRNVGRVARGERPENIVNGL